MNEDRPLYRPQLWQQVTWLSDKRYYFAELKQDLFGQWMIRRQWSGRYQKGGQTREARYAHYEDALAALIEIDERRLKHGYIRIGGDQPSLIAR